MLSNILNNEQLDIALASALPSLGLAFGHVFMWGNNVHMYDNLSLLFSLVFIIAVSILLFFLNFYLIASQLKKLPNTIFRTIFYLYIAILFIFLVFSIIDYTAIPYKNKLYSPILAIFSFFILYKIGPRPIAFFMSIMLCLASVNFSINFANFLIKTDGFDNHENNIALKKKPNIYLYWLESYHDFEILKRFYGLYNDNYKNYLLSKDFIFQDETYSSGYYTLMSFGQLFNPCDDISMQLQTEHLDARESIRCLIGGDKNNFVLKTLKKNGYMTILLTGGDYYYTRSKGAYLDEIDLNLGLLKFFSPIFSINHFKPERFFTSRYDTDIYHGDLCTRVKIAMGRGRASGKPYFLSFKGGADHTPLSYEWKDRQMWISSQKYQHMITASDKISISIIDYILGNDPNALIILIGDHGAHSYRNFPYHHLDSFAKFGIPPKDIADDFFRVILAWHLPKGVHDDISRGMYMNNSNIFMHIFSYLSEDTSILDNRKPVTSKLGVINIVDGKVQLLP